MNDIQLSLIVIGIVAVIRRTFPRIDGPLVALAAVVVAAIGAVAAGPCAIVASLVRSLVVGLSAFGTMAAIRYATRKLDCLCKRIETSAPVACSDAPSKAIEG